MSVTLQINHLYKKYNKNNFYTLNDVNLSIKGGEIVGFLGPNGVGKSTTIKTIVGITNISKGEIKLCGHSLSNNVENIKLITGYVPDLYVLYEKITGREYLISIGDIYKVDKKLINERIKKYSERFNITKALDRPIHTYSHGMKQKIALICSLLHEPKLWILDEPLTGLDPITVMQVKKTMIEYAKKGNIVFFSSHLIDIVRKVCTRVVILSKGTIKKDILLNSKAKTDSLEKIYLNTINDQ